jgi:hypothetical protein
MILAAWTKIFQERLFVAEFSYVSNPVHYVLLLLNPITRDRCYDLKKYFPSKKLPENNRVFD